MTSVVTVWSDLSVTTVSNAFVAPANFNLRQLVSQITAAGVPVTRDVYSMEAWSSIGEEHPADTIQLWVSVTQAGGRKAAEEAAIAAHVPVNYEMEKIKRYTGTTNASGVCNITFTSPYVTVPNMVIETPPVLGYRQYITAKSATGCTCNVYRQNPTAIALLGLTLLAPDIAVNGAPIVLTVFNNDV